MMRIKTALIVICFISIILTGCDSKGGHILNIEELPTDHELILYSNNEGIYPNTDVLKNPNNPYADANINMESVWDLYDECPSAKSKYYLWATILAKIPIGEYQYFTAKSLHELYTVGGSENAKKQAKKAYRAVLDHFFNSVTWWEADWINDEVYYSVLLRNMVGESLYDPSEMNLLPLYSDPVLALVDLSEWGYYYNTENCTISKIE
ncbi:MAG: hypothetical protein KGY75_07180 [Candidatus Cloacimonetes bacterium]|nr:hypothetical protein [Candidatus Cloacimonadota bacterium]